MKQKLKNQDQGNLQIRLGQDQWEKLEGIYADPEDLHGSSGGKPIWSESYGSLSVILAI